jgi:hypothetical protein
LVLYIELSHLFVLSKKTSIQSFGGKSLGSATIYCWVGQL